MDKSSGESNSHNGANNSNNRDHYLKHLNKLSHKISKPNSNNNNNNTTTSTITAATTALIKKPNSFDHQNQQPPPQQQNLQQQLQQQHQPPVYNINKNDFRDVVQKLTGSPAHERFSTPPPINQPKPQSSRLQRIRPPPLAHVSNRPPHMLPCAANPPPSIPPPPPPLPNTGFMHRSMATPLSPLPPFPTVHAAAESPVSAYMRYLQNSLAAADPNHKQQFSGFPPLAPLVSPRWNNLGDTSQLLPPTSQQQQSQFQLPPSPVPFGCLSPRASYPLLSPSPFSPSSGNFPLSPTVPVPSPRWRGH